MPSRWAAEFFSKKRRVEILIVAAVLFLTASARLSHFLDPVEFLFLDFGFHLRGERPMPRQIAVIGIDEASLDHPKAGPWPWPRGLHAQLLERLSRPEARPRAIGYDVFFGDQARDESGDMSLMYKAQDIQQGLALSYFFEKGYRSRYEKDTENDHLLEKFALRTDGKPPANLETFEKVELPFAGLAKIGGLGFSNMIRGVQGGSLKVRMLAIYKGRIYPSLDLLGVLDYLGASPKDVTVRASAVEIRKGGAFRRIPITPEGDMWIDFYGSLRGWERYFPFIHVLLGDSLLSPSQAVSMERRLKDSLVFVGRTASALRDGYSTPFDPNQASVFLRAQAAANILENRYLVRAPDSAAVAVIVILGLTVFGLSLAFPLPRALAAVFALSALELAVSLAALRQGLWIDVVVVQLAIYLTLAALLVFRYISAMEELRRTQAQLLHSTKMAMVGQISSGMAHEFRNIIHAVRLHVEGIARPGVPPEKVQKYMAVVFKILNNAEQILNGILTFSRKNESNRRPTDLKKTVEDTLLLVKKELEYQNIRVVRRLADVSEIPIDAGQMAQVIMNLVNNARDALAKNDDKVVILSLREDEKKMYLDIADNGPGIPPHILKNLFQPFVTSKTEGKGTGLGLSVCRGIVENHGGEIKVTSVAGQGTVWHIILPKA